MINDEEFEVVLENNIGLVRMVVSWFSSGYAEQEDLMQAGVVGLWRAVISKWFDPKKGAWSSYASAFILDEVSKANEKGGWSVRVPTPALRRINRIRRIQGALLQKLKREPTAREIADAIEGESEESVRFLLRRASPVLSVDQPLPRRDLEESERTILDIFSSTDNVEDAVELLMLREQVGGVIEEVLLTPRQRQVIKLKFGMRDRITDRTFREVGDKLGITRQRAQELEAEARKILKTHTLLRRLFRGHEGLSEEDEDEVWRS